MFVYGEDGHVEMPHSFFAHMHAYLYVCAPLYAQKLRRSINLHMHEGTDGYGGSHRRQCSTVKQMKNNGRRFHLDRVVS